MYQKFRILSTKLKSFEDVKAVLWILNKHINLHCDVEVIQPDFRRDDEWGSYPAIRIKRNREYTIEVEHVGFYISELISILLLIKRRLRKRFPYTRVYYLNIEKPNKI